MGFGFIVRTQLVGRPFGDLHRSRSRCCLDAPVDVTDALTTFQHIVSKYHVLPGLYSSWILELRLV